MQKGKDKKAIRIKGKNIFLDGKLFATVICDESHNEFHVQYSGTCSTSSDQSTSDGANNN